MTVTRSLYQSQVDGKDVVDPGAVAVNLLLGGVFNLFAASVVGTRFSLIAVARSDV